MTVTIAQLDALPEAEAAFKLAACCGSSTWVAAMVSRRPFGSREALLAAADDIASTLRAPDWLEAFAHHPRIGETRSATAMSRTAADWSKREQSHSARASEATRAALVEANEEYERRFGFIFIISARGRSADQIVSSVLERLANEADAELIIASREQQQITRLRLEMLIPVNSVQGAHS